MRLTSGVAGSPPGARDHLGKLAVQFGVAFALAMLVMGTIAFVLAERTIADRIDDALSYHSAKFLGHSEPRAVQENAVLARIADWQERKILSERTYVLYDKHGRRLIGRLDLAPPAEGFSDVMFKGGGRSWQRGRALARRLGDGALFVVVQHSEAAVSLRALLPRVVVAVFACAFVAGLTTTLLFARLTARRLLLTQATADAIASGDLSRRIPTEALDGVFARQAASLNRMLDRMEEMVRIQRHFTSALAHELRTPLTRLRTILSGSTDDEARATAAERECDAVIAIFDALLRLAEIERGSDSAPLRAVALDNLIADAAETMEPVIADFGGELVMRATSPVSVAGDADLLNQLVVNLLENVVTHTPSGTLAEVSLAREGDRAVLIVEDNGPGLPSPDRQRVLQPLVRGREAGHRRGSGLGLAISQAIVHFHRGTIELMDNAPGLRVRVTIPVLQAT